MKYHGMTLQEIKEKYYVFYNDESDINELKKVNSRLSELWQDASYYFIDTKSKLAELKNELRRYNEQIEYNISMRKQKYLMENSVKTKDRRLSDKARETFAYVEVVTNDVRNKLDDLYDQIAKTEEELAVWNEILNNLKFISKRIDTLSMNIAVEAKFEKQPGADIND